MLINNNEYLSVVNDIKARIMSAQHKVVLAANSELIMLYWNIGVSCYSNSAQDLRISATNITSK